MSARKFQAVQRSEERMSLSMKHPITLKNVSKAYRLYSAPSDRLKEALFRGRRKYHDLFWAVKNVSLDIPEGATVGVIGTNGSGKSTLLQMIAGIVQPTEGEIVVNGRIAALLELGSGFDPEFSGRENVYMNSAIMGISEAETDSRFSEIAEFAGIGSFIDQPVKKYSSGMFVRLAFATAVNVDPDILLVDEALAVGDIFFQHRCMAKIRKFQEEGKTVFFVSHDIDAVGKLCSHVVLLNSGRLVMMGDPSDVIHEYYKIFYNYNNILYINNDTENKGHSIFTNSRVSSSHMDFDPDISEKTEDIPSAIVSMKPVENHDGRIGGIKGAISAFRLCDVHGNEKGIFYGGDRIRLTILIECNEDVEMPVAGISVKDLYGSEILRSNSDIAGNSIPYLKKNARILVTFEFTLPDLKKGSYSVSAGFASGTTEQSILFDYIENITVFEIENRNMCLGMLNIPIDVSFDVLG
jgi:ABC-type polysaccharide/polyol phosphate transport system ATPase subunit